MRELLFENAGTVIVGILLLLLVVWAIKKTIKNRKEGKTSCGGDCAHCMMNCSDKNKGV